MSKEKTKSEKSEEEITPEQEEAIQKFRTDFLNQRSPFSKAGVLGKCFFNWMNPLFGISEKVIFQQDMHYDLRDKDTSRTCYENIKKNWKEQYPTGQQPAGSRTSSKGLIKVIFKTYKLYFFAYCAFSVMFSCLDFYNAKLMNMSLKSIENEDPNASIKEKLEGAGKFIFALIFSELFITVTKTQNSFMLRLLPQRIQHGVNCLIYQKVMRKSMQRDTTFSLGEITNIT